MDPLLGRRRVHPAGAMTLTVCLDLNKSAATEEQDAELKVDPLKSWHVSALLDLSSYCTFNLGPWAVLSISNLGQM